MRRGAALHSIRAVDPDDIARVAAATGDEPLHAHVSEQPVENAQSLAAFGRTPVAVLRGCAARSVRGSRRCTRRICTAEDVAALGDSSSTVCFCPTTERDLADGIGPARALADAGVRLAIGSDQHAVVDPFDELRTLEGHERLATGSAGRLHPGRAARRGDASTATAASAGAAASRSARSAISSRSAPATPRTAGARLDQLWLAASAADVTDVVVGGRRVVTDGAHPFGDVGARLADAIATVLP